ncbi:MAG: 5'/3'-nucleotidase SurE [Planctomycetota bacterium]
MSNDDGILAPGLAALYNAVADMGEVTVVAPDSPQSAAGHSITLKRPLTVRQVHLAGREGLAGLSVDGRPADCVRLAVRRLMEDPPELVLTGINAGANVGGNVFYSGTVAAAVEAAMLNIPAVAFSAAMETGEVDFESVSRLCRWVLERLLEIGLRRGDLVNVNIPDCGSGRPRGVRVVRQSTAEIEDIYQLNPDDPAGRSYLLADEYGFIGHENDDVACLAEGYITVTPLHVDMTNNSRLAELAAGRWDELPA